MNARARGHVDGDCSEHRRLRRLFTLIWRPCAALVVSACLLAISACNAGSAGGAGNRNPAIGDSGGGSAPRPVGSAEDRDGDGLSDAEEIEGWDIVVDSLGYGTANALAPSLERRRVTSDSDHPDTDGDGLPDNQERALLTDARASDTDGDGLSDFDEIQRWGSSPNSVDSDGDARGLDGDIQPNPSFFDGRELELFGTSPTLDDTDGDSFTDYEEGNQTGGKPLIADVPQARVDLVGDMRVGLRITESAENGQTAERATDLTQSRTSGFSSSDSFATRASIDASVTIGAEAEVSFPRGGSVSTSVSTTVPAGYVEERMTSFTEESSRTTQEQLHELESETSTFGQSVSEGYISMGVKLVNTGDVAFQLDNLVLTALYLDPLDRSRFKTIATLLPTLPAGGVTLGPFNGETGVLQVSTDAEGAAPAAASIIRDLMADPAGLQLEVATFDLTDENENNFAFLSRVTNSRTGLVIIDFGDGIVERHRVATLVDRNPDGSPAGVRMADVLDGILEIDFETQVRRIECDAAAGECPVDAGGAALRDGKPC